MLRADAERLSDSVHVPLYIQTVDGGGARTGGEQPSQNGAEINRIMYYRTLFQNTQQPAQHTWGITIIFT